MTAGLPGVGIGGVFYLLCAFMMPFAELVNTLRGRTNWKRWQMVLTQFGFFCGIMAGFWLTGLLLGRVILSSVKTDEGRRVLFNAPNFFKIQPLFMSLVTLTAVFAALSISNYLLDRRSTVSRKRMSKKRAVTRRPLP
jgi:hypothetical protein